MWWLLPCRDTSGLFPPVSRPAIIEQLGLRRSTHEDMMNCLATKKTNDTICVLIWEIAKEFKIWNRSRAWLQVQTRRQGILVGNWKCVPLVRQLYLFPIHLEIRVIILNDKFQCIVWRASFESYYSALTQHDCANFDLLWARSDMKSDWCCSCTGMTSSSSRFG